MINSGLTLQKHSHRSKEIKRMPTHHYYFPMASVKSKKYGYRKDTVFIFRWCYQVPKKKKDPREEFENLLELISSVR